MSSTIKLTETIRNADRRFGSADTYVPVRIVYVDGSVSVALFTTAEIGAATVRGAANPEDCSEFLKRTRGERLFQASIITIAALLVAVSAWALLT